MDFFEDSVAIVSIELNDNNENPAKADSNLSGLSILTCEMLPLSSSLWNALEPLSGYGLSAVVSSTPLKKSIRTHRIRKESGFPRFFIELTPAGKVCLDLWLYPWPAMAKPVLLQRFYYTTTTDNIDELISSIRLISHVDLHIKAEDTSFLKVMDVPIDFKDKSLFAV